jgi:uncharacterized protein YbaA (DUF1428 family)
MRYVDGYVLIVPGKKLAAYKKMAKEAGPVWMKHGALQYVEAVGDDMVAPMAWGGIPFPKLANAKKGEKVIISFIMYKSKKHRDAVNEKVHKEFEKMYDEEKDKDMPFDMERMSVGGFETLVDL